MHSNQLNYCEEHKPRCLNNNYHYINSDQPYINQYPPQNNNNNQIEIFNEYLAENPHYDKEEPKFQNENERNIHQYLNYVQSKQQLIEKNSKNYLEYIINERKERRTKSPSVYYQTFVQNNNNNISSLYQRPMITNNNNDDRKLSSPILNVYSRCNRLNEITNPDMYYKLGSESYLNYKQQQRDYLNFNLEIMLSNKERKKEINVNPYNILSSFSDLGDSNLKHNTILHPLPNYNYNPYFGNVNHKKIRRSASTGNL